MPMLYETKCNKCNQIHSFLSRFQDLEENKPICCGEKTQRYFSPSSIPQLNASTARVFENFKCPETGQIVTSDRQRNNIMAKHDLIDARETGTAKEHIARAKARHQKMQEKANGPNVTTEWADLTI